MIKLHSIALLMFGVCGATSAGAQQATTPPATPNPLKVPIALPALRASLDDDLIALARAAKINLIADASAWPADAPALAGARTGAPITLLKAQTARPLSWLGQNNALLVWSRPEILALARRIAEGEEIRRMAMPTMPPAAVPPAAPPGLSAPRFNGVDIQELIKSARAAQRSEENYWQERWNEYLATLEGGQTRALGWTREVALSDLPPDLHAFVLASAQNSLLPPDLMAHWRAWMTEDFWNTARLQIRDMDTLVAGKTVTEPPQRRKISMLFIANTLQVVPGQRGNTMMSIANLGDAPTAPNDTAAAPR